MTVSCYELVVKYTTSNKSHDTIGIHSNSMVLPIDPSPIAIFARFTGGSDIPKYVFVIYG